jgi:lactoylglutathione lyase
MRIEHIAIWTNDIETLKTFYVKYFKAASGGLYFNKTKNFRSYFLNFKEGARLELMQMTGVKERHQDATLHHFGIAHFAVSVGSIEHVNDLTEQLRKDGITIVGEPRTTGDGYYESVVLDPDGNRIEITI